MRRAHQVDVNQEAIVEALRGVGATVEVTSGHGHGYPDLTVGYRGATFLLEIKQPGQAAALTPDERKWHLFWRGHAVVVCDVDSALRAVGCRATGI